MKAADEKMLKRCIKAMCRASCKANYGNGACETCCNADVEYLRKFYEREAIACIHASGLLAENDKLRASQEALIHDVERLQQEISDTLLNYFVPEMYGDVIKELEESIAFDDSRNNTESRQERRLIKQALLTLLHRSIK